MREFAKISPQFWINEQGRKIKRLGMEAQLIALYLLTNPHANMIGIYYLPVAFIAHETNIIAEKVTACLDQLAAMAFCCYDPTVEYVWVQDMAAEQLGSQLKINDNRIKAIHECYKTLPTLAFLSAFYEKYQHIFFLERSPIEGATEVLRSKEKENEKKKEKETKTIMSGKPDLVTLNHFIQNKPQPSPSESFEAQARSVLQFLNEKTGRAYRPAASNLKLIITCLKTGASIMDCRQIIAKKTREWQRNPKMIEYLRPATLFNVTKFEQYLGELVLPQEGKG